jgi:hypothetical protein
MNRRIPRALLLLPVLAAASCAGRNYLGQYDFQGRSLAVVSDYPPYPEVLTGPYLPEHSGDPLQAIVKAGSRLAKEIEARRIRARLDSASAAFNVGERVEEDVARRAARYLRARLVDQEESADFVLEVRVRSYGIDAKDRNAATYFYVAAEVLLIDGQDGRLIWKTAVRERDPLTPAIFGGRRQSITRNVVTAAVLSSLSVDDLVRALETLADYSADHLTRRLLNAQDDSRP